VPKLKDNTGAFVGCISLGFLNRLVALLALFFDAMFFLLFLRILSATRPGQDGLLVAMSHFAEPPVGAEVVVGICWFTGTSLGSAALVLSVLVMLSALAVTLSGVTLPSFLPAEIL
jgi:hypothetical protein